jgi:hypothetical protein
MNVVLFWNLGENFVIKLIYEIKQIGTLTAKTSNLNKLQKNKSRKFDHLPEYGSRFIKS